MTDPAASAPTATHPALKLPGFTRAVELGTGLTVHIRKVNVEAITLSTARDVATSPELLAQAQEGAVDTVQELGLVIEVKRRVLQASLIQPTLAELMALYGGTDADPDFGLGNDLDVIHTAIDEFNPAPVPAPAAPEKPKRR